MHAFNECKVLRSPELMELWSYINRENYMRVSMGV